VGLVVAGQDLQFSSFLDYLRLMVYCWLIDVAAFDKFENDEWFTPVGTHTSAVPVWYLNQARILVFVQVGEQLTLEQDRLSGAILVIPENVFPLGGVDEVVGLNRALGYWFRYGTCAQAVLR